MTLLLSMSDSADTMSDKSTLMLREYDSLRHLYSAIPKTIGSSVFNSGQEFSWTCIDVNEKYIAVGTSVGHLFLYDRSKGVICHQLSSQVPVLSCSIHSITGNVNNDNGSGFTQLLCSWDSLAHNCDIVIINSDL